MPHINRAPVVIPSEDWREAWKVLREGLTTGRLKAADAKRMARLLRWIDLVYQDDCQQEIIVTDKASADTEIIERQNVVRFRR